MTHLPPCLRAVGAAAAFSALLVASACASSAGSDSAAVSTGPGAPGYLANAARVTRMVHTVHGHGTLGVAPPGRAMDSAAYDVQIDADRHLVHTTPSAGFEDQGEVLIIGNDRYERGGLLTVARVPPDRWVHVADHGRSANLFARPTDPLGILGMLERIGRAEEVGRESVRGVATNHVRIDLDARKVLSRAAADVRTDLKRTILALGGRPEKTTIEVDAWVDGHGYLRRTRVDLRPSAGAPPDAVRMLYMMETFAFDEPVQIEAPDPSQVIDLPPLKPGGN